MQIYLDNAATTPIEPVVLDAIIDVMKNDFGNPSSIHAIGRKAKTLLEKARKDVAERLGASTGEIFFTSSATESNNMAIVCAVRDLGVKRLISSPTEHPCVLNSLTYVNQHFGTEIVNLTVDKQGNIDFEELDRLLEADLSTMVCLMHGNNEIGTMLDIRTVNDLCAKHQAFFHCDAVQTIGKMDLDLSSLNVTFLSGSGHKIYGPKGAGIIYINHNNIIEPLIRGGGQERQMRSGTENIYGIIGFAKALAWLTDHRDEHLTKIHALRTHFKQVLSQQVPDILFHGNQESLFLPNILSTSIPKSEHTDLVMFSLDIEGICASAGSACSSGAERGSHVTQAIGLSAERKAIRFSLSHHNTYEELDYTAQILNEIVSPKDD